MKRILLFLSFIISLEVSANVFTVINTNDNGSGSLREAITYANAYPGSHTINFNIPTTDTHYNATQGVWTITPLSTMPYITKSNVLIDGTSQALNHGNTNAYGPEIVLNGTKTIDFAFHIYNASNVTVKGFTICNFLYGVQVSGTAATGNIIRGNYIGVNYNATDTAGNNIGIEIIGGPHDNIIGDSTTTGRNIVSGNNHIGIRIVNANNNIIYGNYVGLNRTGNAALRNYDGISIEGTSQYTIVGGNTSNKRNYVSGNVAYGIPVFGAGCQFNEIRGNYIGTDISGTIAIPNTYGVLFDDGSAFNILGGYNTGESNLISGNSGYGVFIYNLGTNSNYVIGNLIGSDVSGSIAIPNANGIVIDGAAKTHLIDSNLISGNLQNGIVIHITGSDNHIITNNKIGTDITGNNPLPNGMDGVRIGEGPTGNKIGMSTSGNIIAYNSGNGITIMNDNDDKNTITENSVFNNAGLGIDLYMPGVNANDAGDIDTGPNEGMNFPVITSALENSIISETTIIGTLDTQYPQGCSIEFFISDIAASGNGEGKTFIGKANVLSNGTFSKVFSVLPAGNFITTTATDSAGNTSEFSANYEVSLYTGTPEESEESKLCVFPNPANNLINIMIPEDFINSDFEISVYSPTGAKVMEYHSNGEKKMTLNINELQPSIYLIILKSNQKMTKTKLMKN
jgi:hypothetical protein